MKKILVKKNKQGTGFDLGSDHNRAVFKDWLQKHDLFEITPRIRGSKAQVRYLEGAVIPAYAHFQYDIDPRDPHQHEIARTLFKQDFHYTIVTDRAGKLRRVARSLKDHHREVLDKYTTWAAENGAPIPNEKLYELWRDEFSMEVRWNSYWDWLHELELAPDAMPSSELVKSKLDNLT